MSDSPDPSTGPACPTPLRDHDTVQLAHGAGGRLSAELIRKVLLPHFRSPLLAPLEDQAVLQLPPGRIAFSTDSFVVSPLFFPGGDIGDLAVNGTVNDVAMSGATPLHLSVGLILEEGLPLTTLERVLSSMERAAATAGVQIVTGDTKVVDRGSADSLFVNTSGVGVVPAGCELRASRIRAGDRILISGTLADHGMAVMTAREGLSFATRVRSDTAALNHLVAALLEACGESLHALRDPTRGGLATTLNEFADAAGVGIKLEEGTIPVRPEVESACELLGIDPLYVANEGKLVAVVADEAADAALAAMHNDPLGGNAALIGRVVATDSGLVTLRTALGVERIIDMPVAGQLPRIC
jgi:hydrogenase expression/formation protein HypE